MRKSLTDKTAVCLVIVLLVFVFIAGGTIRVLTVDE